MFTESRREGSMGLELDIDKNPLRLGVLARDLCSRRAAEAQRRFDGFRVEH